MNEVPPSTTGYEPVPYWAKIPHGITFRGNATSVAVDSNDRVYVFNRGSHPLLVFDDDGTMLHAWTDRKLHSRPHSIVFDSDDCMFLIDDGDHFVEKRSLDGELLLTLGERGKPATWQSGGAFNRPTDLAVHPGTGDLFVSDGYGNSRIHRFSAAGEHIMSWGEPGTDPGQFNLPHNLFVTHDDRVLVCDRENFRIQVFSTEGDFLEQWHMHKPFCITSGPGPTPLLYVGEGGSSVRVQQGVPRLGSCVRVLTDLGDPVLRVGDDQPGREPHQFLGIHGIAVNSRGDIYVAEVSNSWLASLNGPPPLGEWVTLRKWRAVTD